MATFWSASGSNSSIVCCSRVDCRRVIRIGISCHTPFGLRLVLFGGAMVVDAMFGLWLCVLCQICQIHCYLEEWFCQLAMWQKMLPFGKILFLSSLMLYKRINKRMGRLYFFDCLFPKIDLSWSTFLGYHVWRNQIFKGRPSLGWHQSSVSKIWTKVNVIRCYEQWNWYHSFTLSFS